MEMSSRTASPRRSAGRPRRLQQTRAGSRDWSSSSAEVLARGPIIGISYSNAIGGSYVAARDTVDMVKSRRRWDGFWDRLMEAMEDAGKPKTQVAVADLLKIKQPSVHEWRTKGGPSFDNVVALAKALDVQVEWLLTARLPKRPGNAITNEDEADLLRYYRLVDDQARKDILDYARYHRMVNFRGDPERRSEFQERLLKASEQLRRETGDKE